MHFVGETMDAILMQMIDAVMKNGGKVAPRGIEVKELVGVSFELTNPRCRIQYNPIRNINLHFALGEFLWYFSGSDSLEDVKYYNKRYEDYSDDGQKLRGAYGRRIFSSNELGKSQWETIRALLNYDNSSRQAVISIYSPKDILSESKDIPCTCTLQFFIRNHRLDMVVYMRSNDLVWGTPYDVFNFTLMQEIMANELNLELGRYIHFIGSAHIYNYHLELCKRMLAIENFEIKEMDRLDINSDEQVWEIINCAKLIREGKEITKVPTTKMGKNIVALLVDYAQKKKQYCEHNGEGEIPQYFKI